MQLQSICIVIHMSVDKENYPILKGCYTNDDIKLLLQCVILVVVNDMLKTECNKHQLKTAAHGCQVLL